MKVAITIPFEDADKNVAVWAYEEDSIDFRAHPYLAMRCTVSFAAVELGSYLKRIYEKLDVVFATKPNEFDFCIELSIIDPLSEDESFIIKQDHSFIRIIGQNRIGLLYGVYEFLRLQGIRWYAPGKDGEYLPSLGNELIRPNSDIKSKPLMSRFRGFDFEEVSKESAELLLWMVRNRLNMCGYRASTAALAEKLGMKFKVGGHIFESILNPDRCLSNGQTIWQTHQDWYGLPANGKRTKETALATQFCVSNKGLIEFLSKEFILLLKTKWRHADIIDVWGLDTWGSACNCPDCVKLGNGSDQALFLISCLRTAVDLALKSGDLSHNVRLAMCAYEGTATIDPPQYQIPDNLINSGDFVVIYPINRCYAHNIDDRQCQCNSRYWKAIKDWAGISPSIPIMIGEYYNVSRFEDLPLLFTQRIISDIKAYQSLGINSMTYMHVPLVNWAMRTLTQVLYAQMCWDCHIDLNVFIDEYFLHRYGPYCLRMKNAYELIEQAWLYSADWRAWGAFSALSQLQQWDGSVPVKPLFTEPKGNHFDSSDDAICSGIRSISLMNEALEIIDSLRKKDKIESSKNVVLNNSVAVNPVEARKLEQSCKYEIRLGENRRLLTYGIDSLAILVELVIYHKALYENNIFAARSSWEKIEALAEKLDSYYIPISYEWPGAGLISKDALSRTQVRELLQKCRKYRLSKESLM